MIILLLLLLFISIGKSTQIALYYKNVAYIYLDDVTEKALRMDKSYVPKDYYDGYKMGGQTSVSYCAYSDFSAYEYYHKIYPEGLEWLI